MRKLPDYIRKAIRSGPVPTIRDWRNIEDENELSDAEKVMLFAERHLKFPDGVMVGQPLELDIFQEVFLYAVFDNEHLTKTAILSIARRNGKSFLIAVILLAYIVGPMAVTRSTVASAANSRDQAALIFRLMHNMIEQSPELMAATKIVPSGKQIIGLARKTEYYAMSAETKTGHGKSLLVVVLDESGQVTGPSNDYVEMLESSQGSYEDPLYITISTQAPSDADYLSVMMDDAYDSGDDKTIVHLYESDPEADILDESQWKYSNPGLGVFRSESDLRDKLEKASRLPAKESGARNLLLNQRISTDNMWLSPSVWKSCANPIDLDVFRNNPTALGLDLSTRNDLTAAVLAARSEDGVCHLLPFVFCPSKGVKERAQRDRAPYDAWVRDGHMFTVGEATMNYDQIAAFLRDTLDDMEIAPDFIEFDRWRINEFQAACERENFAQAAEWHEVGQGYKDFSPRCEAFQSTLLSGELAHGNHPLLNLAASNAIVVSDPAGSIKIDKNKSTQRIDPLVAAVMAAFVVTEGAEDPLDVMAMVG